MRSLSLTEAEVLIGVGGIGVGVFFEFVGNDTLGRNESRGALLRDWRDYCKLHIVAHYFAALNPPGGKRRVRVLPVGKVGDDEIGRRLVAEMGAAGMDTSYVSVVKESPTVFSVCFLYPDKSGGNITPVNGASGLVCPSDVDALEPEMAACEGKGIAVALPEVSLEARHRLLQLATDHGLFRAAAFTTGEMAEVRRRGILRQVDLLSINIEEAAALAGGAEDGDVGDAAAGQHGRWTREACAAVATSSNPDLMLCITAGPEGSWGYFRGDWDHTSAFKVASVNSAGAGDAFLAAVLSGLMKGMPFISPSRDRRRVCPARTAVETACDYAALVAALSVTSQHTIHPGLSASAVEQYARDNGLWSSARGDQGGRGLGPRLEPRGGGDRLWQPG